MPMYCYRTFTHTTRKTQTNVSRLFVHQLLKRTLRLKYFLKIAFLSKNNLYLQDKEVQKVSIKSDYLFIMH